MNYKLDRPLNIKDLKYKHPLNTYIIDGIPSKMICYVGEETIKILLENPKSDFLFYFYNILEKKHIFSKNFTEHRKRLNEYRKKLNKIIIISSPSGAGKTTICKELLKK